MFDLLIKNTEIIDGTGAPAFRGSVAVKDGKIHMAEGNEDAVRVLDGAGLTLTPGFIDVHSHGDMVAGQDYVKYPRASRPRLPASAEAAASRFCRRVRRLWRRAPSCWERWNGSI